MTKRKKLALVTLIAFAIIGGSFFWWNKQNNDNVTRIISQSPQQNEADDATTDQNSADDAENTADDASPQKDPSPPSGASVTEPPLVYTGYGHGQDDPLKLSQETSTTCTTVAGVNCYIDFKNSNGKTAKLEAKKTDSQGVAVWNWKGDEVGSGTWSVTAVAGDKISSVETIYIQ